MWVLHIEGGGAAVETLLKAIIETTIFKFKQTFFSPDHILLFNF